MSTIKDRVMQLLEYKAIAKESFFTKIGSVSSNFRGKASCSPLNSNAISKIFAEIPDLNLEWLITGSGAMLKEGDALSPLSVKLHDHIVPGKIAEEQRIPLYEQSAILGLSAILSESYQPTSYLSLPNLPKCDGATYVRSDMMSPDIQPGDIIVFKKVKDLRTGLFLGQLYLLSVELEGEEYVLIQYVKRSEIDNHVKLVSANEAYDPKDVPADSIKALAMIKASVRYNTML